jgi:hypothetical protein
MYIVRSLPMQYEGAGYLPTFSKETEKLDEARLVEVNLDFQVEDIDIRPVEGRLLRVSGNLVPPMEPGITAKVTLATETDRETVETAGVFAFAPVAPGREEIYAAAPGVGEDCLIRGNNQPVTNLTRDLTVSLTMAPCTLPTGITIAQEGGQRLDPAQFQVLARRKDIAGVGTPFALKVENGAALLPPGRWEVTLKTPPGYCVVRFVGSRMYRTAASRADGWNEFTVMQSANSSGFAYFTVSSSPGGIHGTVTGLAHEPVAGAPVYVEDYDAKARERVGDLRVELTDAHGQYHFRGLAPGDYRILSTFEYQAPDSGTMENSGAKAVKVEQAGDLPFDLDLWVLR